MAVVCRGDRGSQQRRHQRWWLRLPRGAAEDRNLPGTLDLETRTYGGGHLQRAEDRNNATGAGTTVNCREAVNPGTIEDRNAATVRQAKPRTTRGARPPGRPRIATTITSRTAPASGRVAVALRRRPRIATLSTRLLLNSPVMVAVVLRGGRGSQLGDGARHGAHLLQWRSPSGTTEDRNFEDETIQRARVRCGGHPPRLPRIATTRT